MDGLCVGLYSFRFHVSRTDAVGDEARAVPTVLRGKAIELVDRRGRVRAQLNVSSDGEVTIDAPRLRRLNHPNEGCCGSIASR